MVSDSPSFHEHALGHWTMAIPVVFAALVIVRLPEARTRPRRMARLSIAVFVIALAIAFLLEGIGAFTSGEGLLGSSLEAMHVLGEALTLLSMLGLPLAFVILGTVYALAAMRVLFLRISPRSSSAS